MSTEKFYRNLILTVSVLVPALVVMLFYTSAPKLDIGIDLRFFPKFHAFLNSLATLLLITAYIFIRQKKITAHKYTMISAIVVSAIFLVSYVFYHGVSEPTSYGGEGMQKAIYYFVLTSHIILAALILPFILFTFYRGLSGDYKKHKKIARWTLPVWLYVTITGVLVYFMIAPYY